MSRAKEAALILAPLYERMGWTWARTKSASGIPNVTEIRRCIEELEAACRKGVCTALENGEEIHDYSVATGRLCVRADRWSDTEPIAYALSLELGEL